MLHLSDHVSKAVQTEGGCLLLKLPAEVAQETLDYLRGLMDEHLILSSREEFDPLLIEMSLASLGLVPKSF